MSSNKYIEYLISFLEEPDQKIVDNNLDLMQSYKKSGLCYAIKQTTLPIEPEIDLEELFYEDKKEIGSIYVTVNEKGEFKGCSVSWDDSKIQATLYYSQKPYHAYEEFDFRELEASEQVFKIEGDKVSFKTKKMRTNFMHSIAMHNLKADY